MERTVSLNTNIQLTYSQLTDLAKRLPKKERMKLATALMDEEEGITKAELLEKIKRGLEEVKLYKEGKLELRTLKEFLADV